MSDLEIHQDDTVNIKIHCDRSVAKELSQFFTFTVPNYKYTPAYKNKIWDGQIRLFNVHTHLLYAGLKDYVKSFAGERAYTYEDKTYSSAKKITNDDVSKYINEKIKPSLKVIFPPTSKSPIV